MISSIGEHQPRSRRIQAFEVLKSHNAGHEHQVVSVEDLVQQPVTDAIAQKRVAVVWPLRSSVRARARSRTNGSASARMWSPYLAIPGSRTLSVNDRELGTAYRMRGKSASTVPT